MILTVDQETFEKKFIEASQFLFEASLRYECVKLVFQVHNSLKDEEDTWKKDRIIELLKNSPACKEPWFIEYLRKQCPTAGEDLLVIAGLD